MRTEESEPTVHIYISRWMLIFLAIVLISPCVIVTMALSYLRVMQATDKPPASHTVETSQIIEGKPGPWGRLTYVNITIDTPDDLVSLPLPNKSPERWFFQDYSKDRVIELLKSAGISQIQIDKRLPDAAWQSEINGTWVTPGDDLILALDVDARSKIYAILIAFPENAEHMDTVWFRPETLDKQLKDSGLAESSIKLLKSLLYRNGSSFLLFVDKNTALRQIPNDAEKRLFIKTISYQSTLLARLKIDADSNVEALANYWGMGGNRKEILPLMSSLQRVEGGCNLNVIYLLPHFMREHIYNYPSPSAKLPTTKQDCYWTAFNAFNLQTDDRLSDLQYVHEILGKEYYIISQPSQMGDLVFLANSDNDAVHAAVYLADDIVFTKNGMCVTQPWIIMHLKDMVDTYSARLPPGKQFNVVYYRRKTP